MIFCRPSSSSSSLSGPLIFRSMLLRNFLGLIFVGAANFDFIDQRTRLQDDDDLHAVALGFGKNPDVLHATGGVESANVLFGERLGIRLAGLRPNLRDDPLAGNRLRPHVLNIDGPDNRRALRIGRLPGGRRAAQKRQNQREQDGTGWATNRTDKLFHKVKSPGVIVSDAAQAVLMGKKAGIVKAGFGCSAERGMKKNAPVGANSRAGTNYSCGAARSQPRESGSRFGWHSGEMSSRRCSPRFPPS